MFLRRFLHCVFASLLVMGTLAVTDRPASAIQPAAAASAANPAAHETAAVGIRDSARASSPVRATSPKVRREVFGFALASSLGDPTYGYPAWNFSLLSTVAFFGLHIGWDGTIVSDPELKVWNSNTLTGLLSTAHASGTKVVLTIVMQDFAAGTPNMCAALINRSITVRQAIAQVTAKRVDGLNVDYEGLNGTCQNGQTARAMMTDFVRQLRSALPSGSYLSVDTYAGSAADSLGFYDIAGLNPYVDSFFVMAYDLEYSNYYYSPPNCWHFCLGPTAPLSGYHYNDMTTASQYVALVSPSKVLLGVPYYGRKSCVSAAVPNANPNGAVKADTYLDASGESTASGVSRFAAHRDANDPAGRERWDTWFNSSLNCTRELYWDDATSLGAKYDLVNADNLRGVGIWTLNYGGGSPELWADLSGHFAACAGAGVGANPTSQAAIGTKVTVTATASACPDTNPLYQFWILKPGVSSWQMAQAFSVSSSFTWNTRGAPAGTYRVAVWVRDSQSRGIIAGSLGTLDALTTLQYALYTPCSGANLSVSRVMSSSGRQVTVKAHASGCPNPLYQFWIRLPGATGWQKVQAYSPSAMWQWNTSGASPGTYAVAVWARDSSSPGVAASTYGRLDVAYGVLYTLPCSAVALSSSPSTAAPVGTTVAVTAHASGCVNPIFAFWVRTPGATNWTMVQAYSGSATWRWNTNGAPMGKYWLAVWARDSNSIGIFGNSFGRLDVSTATQYTLTSSACSFVSISSAPPASTTSGTTVTFTAHASGCPNALYQFWIQAPGASSWRMVQAYSTSATLQWNTSAVPGGTYAIAVWARDANSPGISGTNLGRLDAASAITHTLR